MTLLPDATRGWLASQRERVRHGVRGREDDGFRRDGCDSLRAGARRSCARARNDATCRGHATRDSRRPFARSTLEPRRSIGTRVGHADPPHAAELARVDGNVATDEDDGGGRVPKTTVRPLVCGWGAEPGAIGMGEQRRVEERSTGFGGIRIVRGASRGSQAHSPRRRRTSSPRGCKPTKEKCGEGGQTLRARARGGTDRGNPETKHQPVVREYPTGECRAGHTGSSPPPPPRWGRRC